MRRYVYKKGDGYSDPVGLTRLMNVARLRIVAGKGPFTLTQDGTAITSKLSRLQILRRLKEAVSGREIGSVFRVRKGNGDVVIICRAVRTEILSTADSTNGNEHADAYYNWIKSHLASYSPRYAGAYVCKDIVGTSTLSQHSYGNAVDFFFDTMTDQDKAAEAVVANHELLNIHNAISRNRIWESERGGWTSYSGDYHYHLHADFLPAYSGPCGVKG